jgi:predicted glycoside hydrolase/deacetylase ChbG (UPF0249 family)
MAAGLTNRLLGYPADARCLILNADDLGMCHPVNEAIFRAFKEGVATSTSLMVPCPGASRAMSMLRENPEIPFGIHLTVIRDHVKHSWRPLTSRENVTSLVDESGCFYNYDRIPEFLTRASVEELELEFRAQIEAALTARLRPTHLDWHCLQDGGRIDIFDMTLALAREYGFALRVHTQAKIDKLQRQGLPTSDHGMPTAIIWLRLTNQHTMHDCCVSCLQASASGQSIPISKPQS